MLSRIQVIKNVGRFIDCQSAGKTFAADTIIYGKNTNGKSTLTAILRSLREGKPDLIVGRKTFGESGAQEVRLIFENEGVNEECRFPSAEWSTGRPDILIFDNKFVSDSVYEGERVTFEHQQELHQILLGDEGRAIKKDVDSLQERSKVLESDRRQMSQDFQRTVGAKYQVTLESFVALQPIENVSEQIEETEREMRVLRNKQAILGILGRQISSLQQIDFSSVKNTLGSVISVNPSQIEDHISQAWTDVNHTKHFLQEGYALTKSDKELCVFCGQNLSPDALQLLTVYEEFFQQGYEQLQSDVSALKRRFLAFNAEALLRQIQADLTDHELTFGMSEEQIQTLALQKAAVDAEIERKSHNLQHVVVSGIIEFFEESILVAIRLLEGLRTGLSGGNDAERLQQLTARLNTLQLNALRFSEAWVTFSNRLAAIEKEAGEVRTARDKKREELQAYADRVYAIHKDTVNGFLEKMDADFRIRMTPLRKLVGKDERVFSLVFFDAFSVDISEENPTSHGFCNTLSDSDKRVLAFAFFLSLIAHDPDIDKKIVIFDDPISSLDDERKRKSIHLLADVGYEEIDAEGVTQKKRPRQRLIMTHERGFFTSLHGVSPFDVGVKLKIESDGMHAGKKKSKLDHCDIQTEFIQDDLVSYLKDLKAVRDDNLPVTDFEKFAAQCRIALENVFKRKFYFQLATDIQERKSVRTFVTRLAEQSMGGFDGATKQQNFIRLCNDLNIELHDTSVQRSEGDARSIVRDFFDCLQTV